MVKARASNRIVSPYEHWEDLTDARFFAAMEDFERFCEESLVNESRVHLCRSSLMRRRSYLLRLC